jgi:hypothetical protein
VLLRSSLAERALASYGTLLPQYMRELRWYSERAILALSRVGTDWPESIFGRLRLDTGSDRHLVTSNASVAANSPL